ncbi:conserved hypothetical protein [Azorhizobium caulinodans ORS 571]|uniref:Cupin type-2 domain-containing protein n=1 Tax=Azorhizobium caulinodans (strain ATCC 43989 / DSM 5975 / JCM 20966 / LMG 6465 / NBRC 14845 / NCIMB 13405 / ORS 571) TaxID=438753 RepID=A8IN37_AZOC5|nr:cupin domain-containing protein [Azorhizobium caulinodans]BAF89697.1 conserved hypothetical protein [Azorhizobium caulinodans ORS 571]
MSGPSPENIACPAELTIHEAGTSVTLSPEGIASGRFWVEMLLSSQVDDEMTAMRCFLPPGVITHWHSHPRGQLLFVLDGRGQVQREGGPVIEVRAGDSVWFAPGERHWHGATPDCTFSYFCAQAVSGGTAVHWAEAPEAAR